MTRGAAARRTVCRWKISLHCGQNHISLRSVVLNARFEEKNYFGVDEIIFCVARCTVWELLAKARELEVCLLVRFSAHICHHSNYIALCPWESVWNAVLRFHSLGNYKECHLLGCEAVWLLLERSFRRSVSPPSSGWKESVFIFSVLQLLVTANVVPSSLILFPQMMEAIRFSETSVLTRATRRHIAEDGLLHSHRREHLNSYVGNCNSHSKTCHCILNLFIFIQRNCLIPYPNLRALAFVLHVRNCIQLPWTESVTWLSVLTLECFSKQFLHLSLGGTVFKLPLAVYSAETMDY
jgi:hypothetical protein